MDMNLDNVQDKDLAKMLMKAREERDTLRGELSEVRNSLKIAQMQIKALQKDLEVQRMYVKELQKEIWNAGQSMHEHSDGGVQKALPEGQAPGDQVPG